MVGSDETPCSRHRRATQAQRRSSACRTLALGALLSACGTPPSSELGASLELPTPPSAEPTDPPERAGGVPGRPNIEPPKGAFDETGGWLRIRVLVTGEVYVGEVRARDDRELTALLEALAPTKRTRQVMLEVDRDLRYARLIELMDLLRMAAYDEVTLNAANHPLTPSSPP